MSDSILPATQADLLTLAADASSPVSPSLLGPGACVDSRYRIVSLLGVGGMGRVWLAEDLDEQSEVALKEMFVRRRSSSAAGVDSSLLFRREFFVMKKLLHPGTVKVFDCGLSENHLRYITMEVVQGEDLSDVLRRGRLELTEVSRILLQLAQTLAFVHSRLLVHCDIKESNIRLTPDGAVKLMDFGVMHQLGTLPDDTVKGTPRYLAPEWHLGSMIDGRADQYSLGVLGYIMLTGQHPFHGLEGVDLVYAQLLEAPVAPSSVVPISPALDGVILKLLAREPKNRFADAAALAQAVALASGQPLNDEPLAARASYLQVPVVVGRDEELATLSQLLQAAAAGSSRAMLIGAPAGVGKSRLLSELLLQATLLDVTCARGQCRAEGLAPLAPLTQALRALVPQTRRAVLDEVAPVLHRLVSIPGANESPTFRDRSEDKLAVFDGLTRWLRQLASERSFVICIEDLHWADEATLEYLNVIIRALDRTRGLVVGSFRSDELSRLSLAFQTIDEGITERLELQPLSPRAMEELVRLTLPGLDVPPELVGRLHAITSGNTFFATECLRLLVEQNALRRAAGRWYAADDLTSRRLPSSIEEAVLARLSTLSEERVSFLRRLAPAGRALDMSLVRALAALPEGELFLALDEAVERQFLTYAGGRFYFIHDTVHQSVYAHTPLDLRQRFHLHIAEFLEATKGDSAESARAIGYHFARSTQPVRAIHALRAAGKHSLANNAWMEATVVLREACSLLEAHTEYPERMELLTTTWGALVEITYNTDTPRVPEFAGKLFAHWEATLDLDGAAAEVTRAYSAAWSSPAEERSAQLTRLVREIPLTPEMTPVNAFLKRAELRILQSIALAISGRTQEFHALIAQCEREYPPGSPYHAAAAIALGGLSSHTGRFLGVVPRMRGYLEVLREFRSAVEAWPRRLSWALGMGAYFMNMNLALSGSPLDEGATRESLELAREMGFTDLRIYHLFSRVVRASFTGDGGAFSPVFGEMTDLVRRLGTPRLPERNLAIYTPPYYLERGELELTSAIVARAEQLSRLLPGDRWLSLYIDVYRACRDVLAEDVAAADLSVPRALAACRGKDFRMESLVRIYQARLECSRGRHEEGRQAAQVALARAIDPVFANPFDEILARRALAEASSGDDALQELETARAIAARTQNVLQEGIASYLLATRTNKHDPVAAAQHGQRARALFASAHATEWSRRAATLR